MNTILHHLLYNKYAKPALLMVQSSILITLTSCDKENVSSISTNIAPKPVTWDWNQYSQSSEMHLDSIAVDIQPKESYDVQSEGAGTITFEIDEKNTTVNKDQLIARMDVDELEEQERRLQIQLTKTEISTMKADTLDLPAKKKKAKKELEEARDRVELLKLMLDNPSTKEYSNELFGGNLGDIDDNAIAEAEAELSFAEQQSAFAEDFEEKLLLGEREIQEMDTNKNKRNLEEAKEKALYKAPFDGELRLEVNYVEGQKKYTVTPRETIATINNYDEIHANLKVSNAEWISLDPTKLYLQLKDKNNTVMEFKDDRIEKDERTRKEERKYIFSIPLEENTKLKRLTGTQMRSTLIYRLPEQCYIVPKYDISLYSLGKTKSLIWSDVVKTLWPEAELHAVGHKHLAIKY